MKVKDQRYVRRVKDHWVFQPPQRYIDAGIVDRMIFKDGRTLRKEYPKFRELMKRYDKGEIGYADVSGATSIIQLAGFYQRSKHFNSLSSKTRRVYGYAIDAIVSTHHKPGKPFGDVKLKDLSTKICTVVYEAWVPDGPSAAAMRARVFSILMNYAMTFDAIQRNPMAVVKKIPEKRETVIWTEAQVTTFLDTAYQDPDTVNIGLVVHMAYEWCQRPIDILNLRWEDIDFETKVVTITQSKRGATVRLPISHDLCNLLEQHKVHFGHQPYVIPVQRKLDDEWRPMSKSVYAKHIHLVLEKAGLPSNLTGGTLRKSGILEMRDGGADAAAMMNVTGHKSLGSLSPYMKHTLKGAEKALSFRRT